MSSTEKLDLWAVTRGGWVCIWGTVVCQVCFPSLSLLVRVSRAVTCRDLI